jgi:hypothetical protein
MTDRRGEHGASPPDHPHPSRNDGVTIARAICPACGQPFHPSGRRRFCSDACRQASWRHRHPGSKEPALLPKDVPPSAIVYECPSCGSRYLGEQRCPDCQLFCRRVGPGGRCPHCDEPVAIEDLVGNQGR